MLQGGAESRSVARRCSLWHGSAVARPYPALDYAVQGRSAWRVHNEIGGCNPAITCCVITVIFGPVFVFFSVRGLAGGAAAGPGAATASWKTRFTRVAV